MSGGNPKDLLEKEERRQVLFQKCRELEEILRSEEWDKEDDTNNHDNNNKEKHIQKIVHLCEDYPALVAGQFYFYGAHTYAQEEEIRLTPLFYLIMIGASLSIIKRFIQKHIDVISDPVFIHNHPLVKFCCKRIFCAPGVLPYILLEGYDMGILDEPFNISSPYLQDLENGMRYWDENRPLVIPQKEQQRQSYMQDAQALIEGLLCTISKESNSEVQRKEAGYLLERVFCWNSIPEPLAKGILVNRIKTMKIGAIPGRIIIRIRTQRHIMAITSILDADVAVEELCVELTQPPESLGGWPRFVESLKTARIHSLSFEVYENCIIDAVALLNSIAINTSLKNLKFFDRSYLRSGEKIDITAGFVELLSHGNITVIDYGNKHQPFVQVTTELQQELKQNKTLRWLHMLWRVPVGMTCEQVLEETIAMLQHNTTLTSLKIRMEVFDEATSTYEEKPRWFLTNSERALDDQISYLTSLNSYGRATARDDTTKMLQFVPLLVNITERNRSSLTSSVSYMYGLLRENPRIWSSKKEALVTQEGLTRKRKLHETKS